MSSNRLMPEGSAREFPLRIMEPLETRPVLAWPLKEIPSLPCLRPLASCGHWRTRLFAISIRLNARDAEALTSWLNWAQRLDCLLVLDSAEAGRWLMRIAGPVALIPGPDSLMRVHADLECVEEGPSLKQLPT